MRTQPPVVSNEMDYATTLGVRSDARLGDNSVLHLNADSRVHVRYSAHERAIRLDRGEAMFEVTHDSHRPFNVSAHGVVATAVGTTFEVDLLGDAVDIQVFNGVVKVADAGASAHRMRKGEWLILGDNGATSKGHFQPDLTQTWRSDWLQADNIFTSLYFAAGFGGGMVAEGRPFRGGHGNAGEFASILPPDYISPTLERLRSLMADDGRQTASLTDMIERLQTGGPITKSGVAAMIRKSQAS